MQCRNLGCKHVINTQTFNLINACITTIINHKPPMEIDLLKTFEAYAVSRGYEAMLTDDGVVFYNVANPDNNFIIKPTEGYYSVYTLRVSKADYEYTAKCMVYLLMAEFNRDNGDKKHLHINYKVDL